VSVSVFDHPWLSGFFGDAQISAAFAAETTLARMIAFEGALTRALSGAGVIEDSAAQVILSKFETFKPNLSAIAKATERDGAPVPELVRQLKAHVAAPHGDQVHFGATSQDLVDTALVLALRDVNAALDARLSELIDVLGRLIDTEGRNRLMGRTRMQAAVPITAADRIVAWQEPLKRHRLRLVEINPRLLVVQFGGAAGTRHVLGEQGGEVAGRIAAELDLQNPEKSWHAMRDGIGEYASWLSLVTGSLGKMGQDVSLMAQNEFDEITIEGGGGSSAMPHKKNPVKAELLVTLARFNAVQVSGMHHVLVHEQERSGAAWLLEWLILPQMAVTAGAALRTAIELLSSVKRIGEKA